MSVEYRLSSTLEGHSSDVRAVAITEEGDVVTASMDKTTRLWKQTASKDGNAYEERITYIGHSGPVSSVSVAPKSKHNTDGLTITGSRDTSIMVFARNSAQVLHTLTGHTDSVSCLDWNEDSQCLASGSWDHTVRLWHEWECRHVLKGHKGPIWAVIFVPVNDGGSSTPKLLTASADKSIKLWINDKEVLTYNGHGDCVRDLAIIDNDRFISGSNDAVIKLWKFSGDCLDSYYGHSSFIYSIAMISNSGTFISGGEDRTMRVWGTDGTCGQTLHMPAQSIWCVDTLPSGDIVCGTSDGVCRIFTQVPERFADEGQQQTFSEKVSKSTMAVDLGGVKKSDLPEKDALLNPGKKDGQTKMIREGEKIFCYSWSASKSEWESVGEVVGSAGGSAGSSGKVLYQGREYDYVFDVDLDGENALKLPYNSSEDPYQVAQAFIHTHELPQTYLDEVANFIITNANISAGSNSGGYVDPFTGGARYIPGSGTSMDTSGGHDPFTGGGRYVPGQQGGAQTNRNIQSINQQTSIFFPQKCTLRFDACNAEGILNKFRECNQKVGSDLTDGQLQEIVSAAVGVDSNPKLLGPLETALQWPPESVWPALDVLRLALRSSTIQDAWIKSEKGEGILSLLTSLIKPHHPPTTQLLSLRCISNLSAYAPGREVLLNCRDAVVSTTVTIAPYPNKNIEIAAATVLLNYCVILPVNCPTDNLVQVISAVSTIALTVNDPEAQFRSLVSLGTILSKVDEEGLSFINSLDLKPVVKNLTSINDPAKVGECARHVLKLL